MTLLVFKNQSATLLINRAVNAKLFLTIINEINPLPPVITKPAFDKILASKITQTPL